MCEKCGGRGLILVDSDTARICDCTKVKAAQNRLKTSGVPGAPVYLKDFDMRYYSNSIIPTTNKTQLQAAKDAWLTATRFVNEPKDGILLIGPAGRGKTMLAKCTAHELLQKGKELIFIDVPSLLTEIKDTYNENSSRTEFQVLEAASKVKILFMDDLGAHNYSDWVINQLFSIFNYRSNHNLPTFLTSNLTVTEMYDYLGDRITSRIRGMCSVHFITAEKDIRTMRRPRALRPEKAV